MDLYLQVYEFAASAGAFEGYVYRRESMDMQATRKWLDNLKKAYILIPDQILPRLQPSIDQTLGRALKSVTGLLGADHDFALQIKGMIKGPVPESPDAFKKEKWFDKEKQK